MIVDGLKVLYTMRNGKIVDPSIPTDGLVCYLDTRGKTNTDKHKGTLLDLSGNGNHGTLQNFNFTEESGYIKGLSGGDGLKFDGVDDFMLGGPSNNLTTGAFTYMIEFTINKTAKEQNALLGLGMGFYLHSANNSIYCSLTTNPAGNTYPLNINIAVGKHKVIIAYTKDFTDVEYFVDGIRSTAIKTTDDQGIPYTHKGTLGGAFRVNRLGEKIIYRQAIWDRRLSELEIQQLMEV